MAAAEHTAPTSTDGMNELGSAGVQRVPVNVYETEEALVVVAPMPGVASEDVEIVLEGGQLTLRAQLRAPAPGKRYLVREWAYGDYERSLALPEGFGGEVAASLGHGQLAIRVGRGAGGARQALHPASAGA